MRRLIYAAVVALAIACCTSATAQQDGASIAGSLYQYAPGKSQAPALAGAKVFLHRYPVSADASDSSWLGPSVTDGLGRFAIKGVPRGQYLLRVYVGKTAVWDTIVQIDKALTMQPAIIAVHDTSVSVIYFPKRADGSRVTDRLRALGYTFSTIDPVNQEPTNSLWFGSAVVVSDVKLLAGALVEGGIDIRAIRLFRSPAGDHAKKIQIGSDPYLPKTAPLCTVAAIAAAPGFKQDLLADSRSVDPKQLGCSS